MGDRGFKRAGNGGGPLCSHGNYTPVERLCQGSRITLRCDPVSPKCSVLLKKRQIISTKVTSITDGAMVSWNSPEDGGGVRYERIQREGVH